MSPNAPDPSSIRNEQSGAGSRVKVAVLSFFFNWPSAHKAVPTAQLAHFLQQADFEVHHFYVRYPSWGIGAVSATPTFPTQAILFESTDWDATTIQSRFRHAVDDFHPGYVIITDSWNFKPWLAEAMLGYRYFLRLQNWECLCPLNNRRLLPEPDGTYRRCHRHQLAMADDCIQCIQDRGWLSDNLHQAERALSGVGTPAYAEKLTRAFARAEAVLVSDPLAQALVAPFCQRVQVVADGVDPERLAPPTQRDEGLPMSSKINNLFLDDSEKYYAWPEIIERCYRPLLQSPADRVCGPRSTATGDVASQKDGEAPAKSPTTLGCVLSVKNRSPELVKRTLQTYQWQTRQPDDRVLLDYGSDHDHAAAYRELGQIYHWRVIRIEPSDSQFHRSAAHNLAISSLRDDIQVVFKNDVDVLLDPGVLATAAQLGRTNFCLFQFKNMPRDLACPETFATAADFQCLLDRLQEYPPDLGEGLFACPLAWFRQVGGFDLEYRTWGYEDSDLCSRARQSISVVEHKTHTLLHQWHAPAADAIGSANRAYYRRMQTLGSVVRNGGSLIPGAAKVALNLAPPVPAPRWRIVLATRSTNDELYQLSGEFLCFDRAEPSHRVRFQGISVMDYFQQLTTLDANWVISLEDDVFLLNPKALLELVEQMEELGYAVCGLPDGGVVSNRAHNPTVCNAFFNVFDLRRVRRVWANWPWVNALRHRSGYERERPPFAQRTHFQFDDFEPYYGVFFALLEAGERILYLDGETWTDGVCTILRDPMGRPLLLHGWYEKNWTSDPETIQRHQSVVKYLRYCHSHPNNKAFA